MFSFCCFNSKKQVINNIDPVINNIKPVINNIKPIINYSDAITFVPPITEGYVIKTYDGDTITIATKLPYDNSPLYKFSVRLLGIDCPEIKGSSEEEKQIAIIARDFVHSLVFNKIVQLKNIKNEKYGRVLADVYIDDIHLNNELLKKKLAVPYFGKTKEKIAWNDYYHSL